MRMTATVIECSLYQQKTLCIVFEAAGRRVYGEAKVDTLPFGRLVTAMGFPHPKATAHFVGRTCEIEAREVKIPRSGGEILVAFDWSRKE